MHEFEQHAIDLRKWGPSIQPSATSIYIHPFANSAQNKPTTGQNPLNKTTTLSSVTEVQKLFQVTEFQTVSSSGLDKKSAIICDTICSFFGWPVISQKVLVYFFVQWIVYQKIIT